MVGLCAAFPSVPPFFRYAVMPVARNVADQRVDAGGGSPPADHGKVVALGEAGFRKIARHALPICRPKG